jgi:hypothetical protein
VVTVDGTRLAEWRRPGSPGFGAMLDHGALALLSTRTATPATALLAMRRQAYRAFGSGRIGSSTDPTALVRGLEGAGATTTVIASGVGGASLLSPHAVPLPEVSDGVFPTGRRTDYGATRTLVENALATSRVVVVDVGDTARVERVFGADPRGRAGWMRLSMSRADAFLVWLEGKLTADDVLIVASLTAPVERQRSRRFLSTVAMMGGGTRAGFLTTPTTDRDRVVTIADLAPTVLGRAGVPVPKNFAGRAFRVGADARAVDHTRELETSLLHASAIRGPLLRASVFLAGGLALMSLLVVVSGRGRGGKARGFPATSRAILDVGLVAVVALPAALILEPLLHPSSMATSAVAVFGGAIVAAVALRATRGSRDAIAGLCWATVAIIVVDLVLGGPLAERSSLSYLIAEGARFHGIGNELMGVLIGAALIACARLLDSGDAPARRVAVIAVLVFAATVMAAPQLGAKFGSIPAAVPAFALLGLFATNVRLTIRSAIAVAIITLLAGALAVAADALRNPEVQSHVGRAIGDGGAGILGRKIDAAVRLIALSYWTVGIIACGGSILVLAMRRQSLAARGLWGSPALRRAVICCAVAAAGAIAANDAGVIAAAWLAMLAASAFFSSLIVPSDL